MRIDYSLTVDDIITFNMYHIGHSPTIRKQVAYGQIITAFVTIITMFALIYFTDRDKNISLIGFILPVLGGIILFVLFPVIYRYEAKRQARKLLAEGQNTSLLGTHHLSLSPEAITSTSEVASATLKWSAITDVKDSSDYIFLYTSAMSAMIVPKRVFSSTEEIQVFLRYVQTYRLVS